MRKALLVLVFFIGFLGSKSQTFNIPFDTVVQLCPPDSTLLYLFSDSLSSSSYTVDSIGYDPEPIGGTSVNMFDDQVLGPYSIGFNFSYFCETYTQFYICSNGWIGFSGGQTATWVVQTIPSTLANRPKNCIMGPWRDWNPSVSGGPYISYQTVGTAPCRKLIVTWNSVPMFSCTSNQGTFQIVLHETSNIIENHLTSVPVCLTWGNGDGTQGLHNINGTTGVVVSGRNETQFTATNESWSLTPVSPINWTTAGGGNVGTGNCIGYSFPNSQWVYANGVTCGGDSLEDSVFVAVSCIELEMDSSNVLCTGDSSGYAVAVDTSESSGTIAPYTFYWVDGNNDTIAINNSTDSIDTLFNIPSGQYSVYAFDASGEIAFGQTFVNEPDSLPLNVIGFDPVLCFGDESGVIYAEDTASYSGIGWNGLYTFWWANSAGDTIDSLIDSPSNSDTVFNVSAGTYNVTVDGCGVYTGTVTVTEPPVLGSNILNPSTVTCPGAPNCDATAEGSATGGVPPYFYSWSSGENNQIASQLCADTNFLYVQDANGCLDTSFIVIDVPDTIATTASGDTMICITNPATIVAASTGGTPPFSYVWREGSLTGPVVSTNTFENVFPEVTTQYFVSSIDANGCVGDTSEVLIKVRMPLTSVIDDVDTICPYDTIDVTVTGFGGDSIYTYSWSSGEFGPTTTISPDEPSWFFVTVSDQCGTPSYKDSVFVQVGGYSPIDAEIRVEDDSICTGESIYLIASARGGWRGPEEYQYEWTDNMSNSPIQFVQPTKTTEYLVTVSDLCLSEPGVASITVHVGEPWVPDFDALPEESCSNEEIMFVLKEFREGHIYNWEFGDQTNIVEATGDSIFHQYDGEGCYDVTLSVTDPFGCFAQRTEICLVEILQAPTANYVHVPNNPSTMDPFVKFQSTSRDADSLFWYMNSDSLSLEETFVHEFNDTGAYEVSLVAKSSDGCLDTISKTLYHKVDRTLYIPASFTPNGDGLNDVFRIQGEGIDPSTFELRIFDRWGKVVFFTRNPDFGWDGRYLPDAEYVPVGSYPYTLQYTDQSGEIRKIRGQIIISSSGVNRGLR